MNIVDQYNKILGENAYTDITDFYTPPVSYMPIIADDEYNKKFIYRYFVKENRGIYSNIIEIDKDNYSDILLEKTIYKCVKIKWNITGLYSYILRDNYKNVMEGNKTILGLDRKLQNLLEFCKNVIFDSVEPTSDYIWSTYDKEWQLASNIYNK